jgi:hypothetical protein
MAPNDAWLACVDTARREEVKCNYEKNLRSTENDKLRSRTPEAKRKHLLRQNKWWSKNKKRITADPKWRQRRLSRLSARRKTDPNYRLACNLRSRICGALRNGNGRKCDATHDLIGCSIPELKNHLRIRFKSGMTWNNYGQWHVDHIMPCASFDLTDPTQQKRCFHYSNLQPLWGYENLRKGAKILKKEN